MGTSRTTQGRRNTSRSGSSGQSTSKRGRSNRPSRSSRTAPVSFEAVFGRTESDELKDLRLKLVANQARLAEERRRETPTIPLFRTRHLQRLGRLEAHGKALAEAIESLQGGKG